MNGRACKQKGTAFERASVRQAQAEGLQAQRAWGSNGRSLGYAEEVDIVVEGHTGQCKIRKKLPVIVKPCPGVDFQLLRENHGEALVVLPYREWLRLLKESKSNATSSPPNGDHRTQSAHL